MLCTLYEVGEHTIIFSHPVFSLTPLACVSVMRFSLLERQIVNFQDSDLEAAAEVLLAMTKFESSDISRFLHSTLQIFR